ncbi:MAG: SGNH/GDSL hydrolase family protein [Candidatus Omnitrophota bacterium]
MKKLLVFLLGLLSVVMVLEISLRSVSFLHASARDFLDPKPAAAPGSQQVILCLGNSFTKGDGAEASMSYPAQLQRLLDQRLPSRKFEVLNQGKGGQNTSELIKVLSRELDRYRPDFVLLQTGQPNLWNYLRYTDHLRRKDKDFSWPRHGTYVVRDLLYESRVYRLIVLLRDNLRQKSAACEGFSLGENRRYRMSRSYLEATQLTRDANAQKVTLDPGQSLWALQVVWRALVSDPGNSENYVFIGHIYRHRGDYEKAVDWFIRSVEVDARSRTGEELHKGYREIRQMRRMDKGVDDERLNQKIDDFIRQLNQRHPQEAANLLMLTSSQVEEWVESDMNTLVDILQARRIPLMLQNYPIETPVNRILEKIAGERGLPLVDHFDVFQKKLATGIAREDLYGPDTHCSAKGYGIMAENVFEGMKAAGWC